MLKLRLILKQMESFEEGRDILEEIASLGYEEIADGGTDFLCPDFSSLQANGVFDSIPMDPKKALALDSGGLEKLAELTSEIIHIIQEAPDIHLADLFECIETYGALLPAETLSWAKEKARKYINQRLNIKFILGGESTKTGMVKRLLGFSPQGAVRIFLGPACIFIDFTEEVDFITAEGGVNKMAIGTAFIGSPNPIDPTLELSIITGNNTLERGQFLPTLRHEEQHLINQILGLKKERREATPILEKSPSDDLSEDGMNELIYATAVFAKDEILAFAREDAPRDYVLETLKERGTEAYYDFLEEVRKHYHGKTGKVVKRRLQVLYNTLLNEMVDLAYGLLEKAEGEINRNIVIYKLALTPVKSWHQLASETVFTPQ